MIGYIRLKIHSIDEEKQLGSTVVPLTIMGFGEAFDEDIFLHKPEQMIIKKLESCKYVVSYVTELTELEGGQKLVRFYDLSGNLIEVRTPINYN